MDLTAVDYIIMVSVFACAIFGAIKGFVTQIVSIVSLILGVWCACKFSEFISKYIREWFSIGDSVVYIISFIAILIVVIIICHFLGKGIEKIVNLTMLNWLNRLLGFIFAAAKILIILAVAAYIIDFADKTWNILPDKNILDRSQSYGSLVKIYKSLFPYLQELIGQ